MTPISTTHPPTTSSGIYIVVARDGPVHALVDADIARAMPRLKRAIGAIGQILQHCLADQDLAVSVTFEPAPRDGHQCRSSLSSRKD